MLNYSTVSKNLTKLSFNFSNLQITPEYIDFIFEELKQANFTNDDFIKAINKIINENRQLFNLPSKALFLEAANKKSLTDEQEATLEVNKLIEYCNGYVSATELITDNPFLNKTLSDYGGFAKLVWDLDSFNEEKKDLIWIRKDLVNFYLINKAANQGHMIPSIRKSNLAPWEKKQLGIIGDKAKIQLELEENKEEKTVEVIKQLAEQLRKY